MTATTVIRNASVLWGPDLALVERATLVIEKRRVAGLDGGVVPAGAETVDADGLLLMPGFVDCHVHIGFADPAEVLRRGVTTVRDLGWPRHEIFPLARASERPGFGGPLIRAVGPIHTAPGGYPTQASWAPAGTGYEIADGSGAREAVERLDADAIAVKFALNPPVGAVLDHATLKALVAAAHDAGLRTTGHVYGLAELEKSLLCGVDELAHMLMSEEEIPDALITHMVDASMTIVPTLSIRFGRDREIATENLARFHVAGGKVVYGTDLGNEGPGPGIDRTEIAAMAAAGFDSLGVIASATVDAARHLRLESKGVFAEGMDADVVAVPRDALERPELLSEVKMVWREGERAS